MDQMHWMMYTLGRMMRLESRISSDPCEDVYLGPDDEIDYDYGSSGVPDVLDAVPGIAIPAHATPPKCQSPIPELSNEDLHAMLRELMPLGSYDQTECEHLIVHHLNQFWIAWTITNSVMAIFQRPTVHQLLEADRPFRVAWADTSDKLRRADMDLQRLQRAKQMSSELLLMMHTPNCHIPTAIIDPWGPELGDWDSSGTLTVLKGRETQRALASGGVICPKTQKELRDGSRVSKGSGYDTSKGYSERRERTEIKAGFGMSS
ncbi:hypothetical protein BDR07DRAFT_1385984 [Suillus spraguei]|nr:hypothetical protein BDR07DRAFT_1385984 [Suillus spraguei]